MLYKINKCLFQVRSNVGCVGTCITRTWTLVRSLSGTVGIMSVMGAAVGQEVSVDQEAVQKASVGHL